MTSNRRGECGQHEMKALLDELTKLRADLIGVRRRCDVAILIVAINLAATFTILGVLLGR